MSIDSYEQFVELNIKPHLVEANTQITNLLEAGFLGQGQVFAEIDKIKYYTELALCYCNGILEPRDTGESKIESK